MKPGLALSALGYGRYSFGGTLKESNPNLRIINYQAGGDVNISGPILDYKINNGINDELKARIIAEITKTLNTVKRIAGDETNQPTLNQVNMKNITWESSIYVTSRPIGEQTANLYFGFWLIADRDGEETGVDGENYADPHFVGDMRFPLIGLFDVKGCISEIKDYKLGAAETDPRVKINTLVPFEQHIHDSGQDVGPNLARFNVSACTLPAAAAPAASAAPAAQAAQAAPAAPAVRQAPAAAQAGPVGLPEPQSCALRNPDQICYMNSSIQLLYNIDDFRTKILASRSKNPYAQALRIIFYMMMHAPANPDGSRYMTPPVTEILMRLSGIPEVQFSLRALLSTSTGSSRLGKQEDSQEFIGDIFSKLDYRDPILQASDYYEEDMTAQLPDFLETVRLSTQKKKSCFMDQQSRGVEDISKPLYEITKREGFNWAAGVDLQTLLLDIEIGANDIDNWLDGCPPPEAMAGFPKGPVLTITSVRPESNNFLCYIKPFTDAEGKINRTDRPVQLNPVLIINGVKYGLAGYTVHLGDTIKGGHYVYVKCGPDFKPSFVLNDRRIIPASEDDNGNLEYQSQNAYVVHYKRIPGEVPADEVERVNEMQELHVRETVEKAQTQIRDTNWTEVKIPYIVSYLRTLIRTKIECPSDAHKSKLGYNTSKIPPYPSTIFKFDDRTTEQFYRLVLEKQDNTLVQTIITSYNLVEKTAAERDAKKRACDIVAAESARGPVREQVEGTSHAEFVQRIQRQIDEARRESAAALADVANLNLDNLRKLLKIKGVHVYRTVELDAMIAAGDHGGDADVGLVKVPPPNPEQEKQAILDLLGITKEDLEKMSPEEIEAAQMKALGINVKGGRRTRNRRSKTKSRITKKRHLKKRE